MSRHLDIAYVAIVGTAAICVVLGCAIVVWAVRA